MCVCTVYDHNITRHLIVCFVSWEVLFYSGGPKIAYIVYHVTYKNGSGSSFHTWHHEYTVCFIIFIGRLLPEELELFYDSWKNIVTMNKHAQTVAAYKSVEVI